MTAQTIEQLLFHNSAYILLAVKDNNNITSIERATVLNRSWIVHLIKQMEVEGLIARKKDGRYIIIKLTPKGRKIVNNMKNIMDELRGTE